MVKSKKNSRLSTVIKIRLVFICVLNLIVVLTIGKTQTHLSSNYEESLKSAYGGEPNTRSGNIAEPDVPLQHLSVPASEPCALLFFGRVIHFKSTILPSIQKNIIQPNKHCDIFLHTYNITVVPKNPRSSETGLSTTNITEAYLLVANNNNDVDDHIVFESMESFYSKRAQDVNRTRQNFHEGYGECCISHDHMMKQWNSIEGAWDLMRSHEKKILSGLSSDVTNSKDDENDRYYKYVGLFRTDVFYLTPIEVSGAVAVVPKFTSAFGFNDRMFYGKYEWAKVWATKRFGFIPEFEKRYMIHPEQVRVPPVAGFHSEFFLKNLMNHYKVPVMKSTRECFLRVRSGPKILKSDCKEYSEYNSIDKVNIYLSKNVTLVTKG